MNCWWLALLLLLAAPTSPTPFRGVYFNPLVKPADPNFPWLCFYPQYRAQIRAALRELADETRVNLVDIFVCIAYSLKTPSLAPQEDQPLTEWANLAYLDGVATFVDDCQEFGLSVELDLVSNMWIPRSADPTRQIANSGYWPMPDETPWNESAAWYSKVITYIEARAKHPENIALWSMMGNYELGAAEPYLWLGDDHPAIRDANEQFVKRVWPVFRAAGKRPKAPPFMMPIFSNNSFWRSKTPQQRLSGFTHLKKWIVDDLALPPDYWIMSSYAFCDPAPDGFHYLREIVRILGPENASHLLSTDLKGPGHDDVRDCIVSIKGRSGPELLEWHFRKRAEYGLAGWWIWAYQDTPQSASGLRDVTGAWKVDLTRIIRHQAGEPPR